MFLGRLLLSSLFHHSLLDIIPTSVTKGNQGFFTAIGAYLVDFWEKNETALQASGSSFCVQVCGIKSQKAIHFIIFINIVRQGTGYETLQVLKAIMKVLQLMLKVLRPCTIFYFKFTHYG